MHIPYDCPSDLNHGGNLSNFEEKNLLQIYIYSKGNGI